MSEYIAFKMRLRPFHNDETELLSDLDTMRELWNYVLERKIFAYKFQGRTLGHVHFEHELGRWRKQDPNGIGRILSHVAQDQLARNDAAYDAFFRRVRNGEQAGFPKFKDEVTSLTWPDGDGSAAIVDARNGTKRLHLSRARGRSGMEIPIVITAKLPEGNPKTATIEREGNKWFAILTYETPCYPPAVGMPASPIGIDVGLPTIVALSDGTEIAAPRFFRKSERHLTHAQRRLKRMTKGSTRWHRQQERIARIHEKIRHQRGDFIHKHTTAIVAQHDLVAAEGLSIKRMVRSHTYAKSISDAAWGQIRQQFAYKERRRSGRYVEVDARGTTQECSNCHSKEDVPMGIKDRVRSCSKCGLVLGRDVNAAKNILCRSLVKVSEDLGTITPVETARDVGRKGRRKWSVKRQASPSVASAISPLEGPSGPSLETR